tara:strand:+ start:63 stop:821 length:759 start_codon:yes stop_codon:yes gene_type:complete
MFRRGGQAEGITTGLGRERHANGDVAGKFQDYRNILDTISPRGTGNINDFLMNLSLNLVGNPPSGNILQTVAKEAQGPFQQLQRARAQERSADRSLAADWLKTLTDDEKIALQEQIDYLVEEFDISAEEALNRLKPTFRKDQSPEETARESLEAQVADLTKSVGQGGPGWSHETAIKIAKASQKKPEGKEYDTQNIAIDETDVATGLGSVDEETGVITIAEPQGDYIDGFTYYNYIKDKWYTYNNGRFIPVE